MIDLTLNVDINSLEYMDLDVIRVNIILPIDEGMNTSNYMSYPIWNETIIMKLNYIPIEYWRLRAIGPARKSGVRNCEFRIDYEYITRLERDNKLKELGI